MTTHIRISLLVAVDLPPDDAFRGLKDAYKVGSRIVGHLKNKPVLYEIKRFSTFSVTQKDKDFIDNG